MDWYLTDSKSRITRESHSVKKTREFHENFFFIMREKISGLRANSFVVLEQFYNVQSILKLFYSVFPGFTEFLE